MRIAVTGSIATDHLMTFPGRFTEQLIADRLDRVSLSFLVDTLEVRRGGVAANIAYGLGRLGLRPLLVGAAGPDFTDHRSWLEANGVDTAPVRISTTLPTARFVCTTDADHNQIASFYRGAMAEAADIPLAPLLSGPGAPDLVVVSPDDPVAMEQHTRECRELGVPFVADPSQQLATLDGETARFLVEGAQVLFTNEYEADLLQQRTGWTRPAVLKRVGSWVTTLGERGAVIESASTLRVAVPAVRTERALDPTGVGDAFRAGFLAGVSLTLSGERSAQLGCALATLALESTGPQEYALADADALLTRIGEVYGPDAARGIRARFVRVS